MIVSQRIPVRALRTVLRRRPRLIVLAAVAALALVETTVALVAPSRAPTEADWRAAAAAIRGPFRPGDLIVAAPAWADPILRVHLGDLIPPEVAGRMDDDRFGRVWEVSQRGARADAASVGSVAFDQRFGALRVRRIERPAPAVRFDFVARAGEARVQSGSIHRQLVEVDTRLRMALLTEPVPNAAVVVEFPAVSLGRELLVATGLHNVWMRKAAQGAVDLQVRVGPSGPTVRFSTHNDDGWKMVRIDTSSLSGQVLPVRFEISSPEPRDRYFAFAAEARG